MKLNLNRSIKGLLFGGAVLLTGCGTMGCSSSAFDDDSRSTLLEGTILEDAYVITDSNNNVVIARPTEYYQKEKISGGLIDYDEANHYIDVISNNCYHEKVSEDSECRLAASGVFSIDVEKREPVSSYLTSEDLLKSEFTPEDIVEIIQRVKDANLVDTNVSTEGATQYTK